MKRASCFTIKKNNRLIALTNPWSLNSLMQHLIVLRKGTIQVSLIYCEIHNLCTFIEK